MKQWIILAVSIVLLSTAVGAYTFLIIYTQNELSAIATIRDEISTQGQREAIQNSQQSFIDQTQDERKEIETFITRDADIVRIIETIEAAGRREKVLVSIGSVTVEPIANMNHVERIRITLSARGAFPSLGAFTTALESFPVASRLESVQIEASTNKLWFGTYSFDLVKEKST